MPQIEIHFTGFDCQYLSGSDNWTDLPGLVTCKHCLKYLNRAVEHRNEAVAGRVPPSEENTATDKN